MSLRRWLLAAATAAIGVGVLALPASAGTPARDVTMLDNRYLPSDADVAQAQSVEFENFGQVVHDARDGTGLELFDTGYLRSADTSTVGPMPGAGVYRYYCTFHPEMAGRLSVPVTASRAHSPAGSPVTIRWAVGRAPGGLVFDVQRRRPGTHRFEDWRVGVTAAAARLWPSVRGTLALRARVHDETGASSSDWSPVRTVQIT